MSLHMAKRYKPFSTTRQSMDWIARNCDTCKKGFDKKGDRFRCDWEQKLCAASIYGDPINEETAKAIGLLNNKDCTIWECPGWARK